MSNERKLEWHHRKGTQVYDEHFVSGRWDVWHEGSDDGDRWVVHCCGVTNRVDDSAILAYRETFEEATALAASLENVIGDVYVPENVSGE